MAQKRLSFDRIAKKGNSERTYLFRLDDSIIWTNGAIIVRDDFFLNMYFGRFVLDKAIEQGKVYNLNVYTNPITIDGEKEVRDSVFDGARKLTTFDPNNFKRCENPDRKIIYNPEFGGQAYCLVAENRMTLVDKNYYEYFSQLGFKNSYIRKNEPNYVIFNRDATIGEMDKEISVNGEIVIGVAMPIVCPAEEGLEGKVADILKLCL